MHEFENPKKMPIQLSDLAKDFLKEEQKQRRTQIENLIGRIETDQQYGLGITGLVWSWLAANQDKLKAPFNVVAVCIPVMVMLFFLMRWKALNKAILQVAAYTKTVERLFEVPEEFGWETYADRDRRDPRRKDILARSTLLYWRLLIVANLALAGLFVLFARR
jgi:hypothetical protein